MQFKYGLIYMGVQYGWHKKQLYRLPFTRNNRSYNLKLINPIVIGSTTCYNLQRNKVTIKRIETLTTKIDWFVEVVTEIPCPF
jgi:hypothetical protein